MGVVEKGSYSNNLTFFFITEIEIEPKALCMLERSSTTELYPQSKQSDSKKQHEIPDQRQILIWMKEKHW
jgi:hypothetical protein